MMCFYDLKSCQVVLFLNSFLLFTDITVYTLMDNQSLLTYCTLMSLQSACRYSIYLSSSINHPKYWHFNSRA